MAMAVQMLGTKAAGNREVAGVPEIALSFPPCLSTCAQREIGSITLNIELKNNTPLSYDSH